MAKKFVRGITDVKDIKNFDKSLTNVNDIISDGQNTYIHTKKGENELYYKLTDRVTSIKSTGKTITVEKSDDGTVSLKTNPEKVLEHEKLKTGDGLTTSFNTDETTIMFKATRKPPETNLNTLGEGIIRGNGFSIDQVPSGNQGNSAAYVTFNTSEDRKVQFYIREGGLEGDEIRLYYRFIKNGEVTEWKEMVGDSGELINQLAQKQDVLTAGNGITIDGQTISYSGATSTIQRLDKPNDHFIAIKHVVTSEQQTLTTLSFKCYNAAETVLTGELKEYINTNVKPNTSISNGALTITNDGTNIKLINSAPSENVHQQGIFTFYDDNPTGGGSAV